MSVMDLEASPGGYDDEGFDIEAFGESDDDAEFLPGILGTVLPGLASGIGGAVSGLLGPRPAPRPPLPPVRVAPVSGGVSNAVLQTPAGNATVQLSQPAVSKVDFDRAVGDLRAAINEERARINALQRDAKTTGDQLTALAAETRRDLGRLRQQRNADARRQAALLARLRRDQQSQGTMNMLMSMLAQKRVEERLDEHTHSIPAATSGEGDGGAKHTHAIAAASAASAGDGSDKQDMMLLMLPMMMASGGEGGGGGPDPMMMAAMAMAMR